MAFGSRNNNRDNGAHNDATTSITITYNGYCPSCQDNVWANQTIAAPAGSHGVATATIVCACGGSVPATAHF